MIWADADHLFVLWSQVSRLRTGGFAPQLKTDGNDRTIPSGPMGWLFGKMSRFIILSGPVIIKKAVNWSARRNASVLILMSASLRNLESSR